MYHFSHRFNHAEIVRKHENQLIKSRAEMFSLYHSLFSNDSRSKAILKYYFVCYENIKRLVLLISLCIELCLGEWYCSIARPYIM